MILIWKLPLILDVLLVHILHIYQVRRVLLPVEKFKGLWHVLEHLCLCLKQLLLILMIDELLIVLVRLLVELVLVSELILKVNYIHLVWVPVVEIELLLPCVELIRVVPVVWVYLSFHVPSELVNALGVLISLNPLLLIVPQFHF